MKVDHFTTASQEMRVLFHSLNFRHKISLTDTGHKSLRIWHTKVSNWYPEFNLELELTLFVVTVKNGNTPKTELSQG